MRLRAINIFSAFLGDLKKTKERTVLIRKESDFLYLEYYNAKEIAVSLKASDGYSVITMPFNFSLYQTLSTEEKNVFWVEEITKVFNFVLPLMKCKSDKKIIDFIDYLNEKYNNR